MGSSGASGNGIDLDAGGSVTNLSGGTNNGGGVYLGTKGSSGTVINSGIIIGDSVYGGGVYMKPTGGVVTNLAGTIAANGAQYGIKISGGAGTVTNAATITGGSASGNAIILSAVAGNRIIDQTGGVFIGAVNGGSNATMELASSATAGTLTATADQFTNFSALYIDPGARWTIKGDSGLASERVLQDRRLHDRRYHFIERPVSDPNDLLIQHRRQWRHDHDERHHQGLAHFDRHWRR